jgi:tripartite motif-containing protein 71
MILLEPFIVRMAFRHKLKHKTFVLTCILKNSSLGRNNAVKFLNVFFLVLMTGLVSAHAQINLPTYAFSFGSAGTNAGQFNGPVGLAVDTKGNVYVADENNNRIQEFISTGNYIAQWGILGTNAGQFNQPFDLAIDTNSNIFVSDDLNNRIQKFSNTGAFLIQWGSQGTDAGQFRQPHGLAVDNAGNLYVADKVNDRIEKFTGDGAYLAQFGSSGTNAGQLKSPRGLARDVNGNIYVADQNNRRVVKFTGDGTYLTQWGSQGTNAGQFGGVSSVGPNGVAVDKAGNVWVSDEGNDNIQIFTAEGGYISQFGTVGTNAGQFKSPDRLIFDPTGTLLYVSDFGNNRVQVFNYTYPPPFIQTVTQTNGNIIFTWSAIVGRNYQVQFLSDLNSNNWNNLTTVVATNYTTTVSDASPPDAQRFYRVELLP